MKKRRMKGKGYTEARERRRRRKGEELIRNQRGEERKSGNKRR